MKEKGLGARIRSLFGRGLVGPETFEDLEDVLIEADIGALVAMGLVGELREQSKKQRISTHEELVELLARHLRSIVLETRLDLASDRMNIVLLLGVNGVGKTTSLAKLSSYYRNVGQTESVVVAAGDTFRAAAVEQLSIHADRLGVRLISQGSGADPAAVIYDAIESARSKGDHLVLVDTAGRMHTKANLVSELEKIDRIVASRAPDALYRRLLVIDATTGQNGLRQAEVFGEAVEISGIVLAKYDSTAKGGILIPIAQQLQIPAAFVGVGETYEDFYPFDADRYVDELLGIT